MASVERGDFDSPNSDNLVEQDDRTIYRRVFDYLKDAKLTVSTTLGFVAINVMYGDRLVVHSSDPLERQLEMAIPSAFGTPDATGVRVLDFGGVTALTMATLEASRRTTPVRELVPIAVGAQVVSCGTDALVDQTGVVGDTMDVGSSAIAVAWGTKFFLDHIASAEDETSRRRWKLGAAAFASTLTLGAYVFLGGDDGKLDLISHCSALAVGATAYRFGSWRRDYTSKDARSSATGSLRPYRSANL